jgi:hypothetical protein
MKRPGKLWYLCLCAVVLVVPAGLRAQTDCDQGNGPLNSAQPQSTTPDQIIQKFAAREAVFKEARNHYTYTQEVTVQTLEGNTVDGELRETTDILYDDHGRRLEEVKFAPQSTLQRVLMTKEDYDDIRNRLPFVLTTEDIPGYNILYAGQQTVDELETYVFDVAPKKVEKEGGKRYFQGRIWVDNKDFQIVKTCGKNVPDIHKKGNENLTPRFVTYREQIDGQYWFPTYTRADDVLKFSNGDVHIREIVKYTNYKRFGVKTRITYKGEVPEAPKQPTPK